MTTQIQSRSQPVRPHGGRPLIWGLTAVVVVGLVIDAIVHLWLAPDYQLAFPDGLGGGTLFRIQAGVAVLAAVAVLLRPGRTTYLVAMLVAASALIAVVVSRYVEIPQIGPLPSMYEPLWFFEKVLSAVGEAFAAVGALILLVLSRKRDRNRTHP